MLQLIQKGILSYIITVLFLIAIDFSYRVMAPQSHWIEYFGTETVKEENELGKPIPMVSRYIFHRSVDVSWENSFRCSGQDGVMRGRDLITNFSSNWQPENIDKGQLDTSDFVMYPQMLLEDGLPKTCFIVVTFSVYPGYGIKKSSTHISETFTIK